MGDLAVGDAGRLPGPTADRRQALRQACRQWEAVFLQQILREAREEPLLGGGEDEPLLDGGAAGKTWKGMLDDALAERSAGGAGIADIVYRELAVKAGLERPPRSSPLPPLRTGGLP